MYILRIVFWLVGLIVWIVITHQAWVKLEPEDFYLALDVGFACLCMTLQIAESLYKAAAMRRK
jgi:hypothetical protein